MAAGRVIVVGSVNVDLVARVPRLPVPGETVTGGAFSRHHGGKGGNQAVAAARLGASTAFVGAIGGDAFGSEAREALAAAGVALGELRTVPAEATGVALILVDTTGENVIAVASGANGAVAPTDVETALGHLAPSARDVVLVGHEIPTAAARAALRAARAAGATTVFNPAPATGLDRSTFGLGDYVTPNRTELEQLVADEGRRLGRPAAGHGTEAAARTLLERNAEGEGVAAAVVVTLGADGALVVPRDGAAFAVAPPTVRAVDTVGAGDAFNGALATALAEERPVDEAARIAVAAGSLATTRPGAREGMPTRADLERILAGAG